MVHLLCSSPPCSGFPWNPDTPSPSTFHLHCFQCCIAKRGSLFIKCTASAPSATLEDVHRETPEIVHQKVTPWIENCGEAQLDDRRDQVECFDVFPSPSKHHGTILHMEALAVVHQKAIPCMENCGEAELDPLCIAVEIFDAFPSLLKRHGKSKSLSDGRLVHCRIIACGCDGSTFMANCLVQMYGDCGSLHDAETAFHKMPYPNQYSWNILVRAFSQNGSLDDAKGIFIRMPHRDVVSWNGMIGASIQHGRCKEALDLFIQMQHEGIQPNRISLLAALDACSSMASLNEGHKIHAIIVDFGIDRDDPIGNALINMHAKCGNLEGAKVMFGRMQECNVISWSAMIAAYARNGHCEDALSLFYRMQAKGIKPDKITFISVLTACANLGALAEGQQIHAAIMDCKYEQDVTVGNALVNMYAKCGNFCNARLVFNQLSERDVVSWTTLIGACSHSGHDKEALEMFGQMQHEGIKPNHLTIVCALDACANLGALKEGKEIHEAIANSGYVENVYVGNALVNMYGKCGLLDEARGIFSTMSQQNVASWNSLITVCGQSGSVDEALSLFERMPERNVISWNALISALVQNGHGKEAIEYFDQMQLESIIPNKVTFVTVLDACASLGALELGLQLHALSICTGYEQDGILQNALVNMYGKCGCLDNSKFVFDMMHQRNVISWSAMIAAYVKNGQGNQAVDLFWKMELQGVRPDKITFTCLLAACANLATIEEGQKVHASIVAGNLEADLAVGNALLSMYGRCGSIESVKIVFSRMHHQDVVSWTAVIAGCAQCGESKAALELFSQMQVEGIKPDEVTFISVLTACCHSGRVDDGRRYFSSMVRDYGLAYRSDHYVCMVDLLGRAGHLEEAEDLIYSMPVDKIYLAWLSLLGSCRNHGDIKHGIRAALCCFQSDPKNDAPFSLLSSIFAAAGRSNGQAKMNELQKLCLEKQVEELVQELLSVYDEL